MAYISHNASYLEFGCGNKLGNEIVYEFMSNFKNKNAKYQK